VEEKKSSKGKPNSASIELAGMKHDVQELLQYPHTALEDRLKYKFKRQQIDISDIALHIDEDGLSIDLRGKPTKTRHVNVLPDRAPKKRLFGKNDSAPAKKTPAREPVSPPAVEAPPAPPATSEPLKSSLEDPVDEELIEKPFAPAAKKIKKERIKKFFAKLRDGWREGLALRKEYNEGIREERQERRAAVKKKIAERKKTRKEARDARILARKNKQERKRKRTREIIRKIYTSRITRAIEFVGGPVLSYLLFPDVVSQYVGLAAFIHSGVQTLILYLNKHAKHGSHH
jgi:hypothetical protein